MSFENYGRFKTKNKSAKKREKRSDSGALLSGTRNTGSRRLCRRQSGIVSGSRKNRCGYYSVCRRAFYGGNSKAFKSSKESYFTGFECRLFPCRFLSARRF